MSINFETINGQLCRMVEPKPEFRVGDGVEFGTTQCQIISIGDATSDGAGGQYSPVTIKSADSIWTITGFDNLRKLKPSEVKVKITLEGTVSQDRILYGATCFTLKTRRSEYIISLHEIEEDELVESLLKSQEEK